MNLKRLAWGWSSGLALACGAVAEPGATSEQVGVDARAPTPSAQASGVAPSEPVTWVRVGSQQRGEDADVWRYTQEGYLAASDILVYTRANPGTYRVVETVTHTENQVISERKRADGTETWLETFTLDAGRVVAYEMEFQGEVTTTETYGYDTEGKLISVRSPNSGWDLLRDEQGRPISATLDETLVYSAELHPEGKWFTEHYVGAELFASYESDESGNLLRTGFFGGGNASFTEYSYDAAGRLVRSATPLPDAPGQWHSVEDYTYDERGNFQARHAVNYVEPSQREERYTYDAYDRLVRIERLTDGVVTSSTEYEYVIKADDEVEVVASNSGVFSHSETYRRFSVPVRGLPTLPDVGSQFFRYPEPSKPAFDPLPQ